MWSGGEMSELTPDHQPPGNVSDAYKCFHEPSQTQEESQVFNPLHFGVVSFFFFFSFLFFKF